VPLSTSVMVKLSDKTSISIYNLLSVNHNRKRVDPKTYPSYDERGVITQEWLDP
jgi:hypothetical protein